MFACTSVLGCRTASANSTSSPLWALPRSAFDGYSSTAFGFAKSSKVARLLFPVYYATKPRKKKEGRFARLISAHAKKFWSQNCVLSCRWQSPTVDLVLLLSYARQDISSCNHSKKQSSQRPLGVYAACCRIRLFRRCKKLNNTYWPPPGGESSSPGGESPLHSSLRGQCLPSTRLAARCTFKEGSHGPPARPRRFLSQAGHSFPKHTIPTENLSIISDITTAQQLLTDSI